MTTYRKTFGRITVETSSPYPYWTEIKTDREDCQLFGIHHDELADLHYTIGKALEAIKANESKRSQPLESQTETPD